MAVLDGYIYAVGGWEGTSRLNTVERFNPSTNSWSFVASMAMALTSTAVVAYDGLLYVTGSQMCDVSEVCLLAVLNGTFLCLFSYMVCFIWFYMH